MIQLEPTPLDMNGVMKVRIVARLDGKIIDAEVLTVESSRSRGTFAKRLAEKTGEDASGLEQQILELLNQRPEPVLSEDTADLLAKMPEDVRQEAERILASHDLIERVKADITKIGYVGDEIVTLGIFLAGVSRKLAKPISVIVRGATASGKSHAINTVAKLFPAEEKVEAHHLSAKALYYLPDDALRHKMVIGGERARRQDDEQSDATKALREMISDGVLRAAVTETVNGKLTTVQYEKQGPIAHIESTSASTIFAEDLNRCLVFHVDESESQTERIIRSTADAATGIKTNNDEDTILIHRAIQRMIKPYTVVIPFAHILGEFMPTDRVEARRVWPHLLNTIRAVALLRQYQKTPINGTLSADADDYAVALEVVKPSIARLKGSMDQQVLRVWESITRHAKDPAEDEFTREMIAGWAGCQQTDTNGRVKVLCERGFLIETQEHRGSKPAKFKVNPKAPDLTSVDDSDLPPADAIRSMEVSHAG